MADATLPGDLTPIEFAQLKQGQIVAFELEPGTLTLAYVGDLAGDDCRQLWGYNSDGQTETYGECYPDHTPLFLVRDV